MNKNISHIDDYDKTYDEEYTTQPTEENRIKKLKTHEPYETNIQLQEQHTKTSNISLFVRIAISVGMFLMACPITSMIYASVIQTQINGYPCGTCGSYENITQMTMTQDTSSLWKWKYVSEYGYFEQLCPTNDHNLNVYRNDNMVLRTNGKTITSLSTNYFNDCCGVRKYNAVIGHFFQTYVGNGTVTTTLLLLSAHNDVIAYVSSNIFTDNFIVFRNQTKDIIATIKKFINGETLEWTYDLHNTTDISIDILIAITGKLSFEPNYGIEYFENDGCNLFFKYLWIVAITLLCVASIMVFIICCKYRYEIIGSICCKDIKR